MGGPGGEPQGSPELLRSVNPLGSAHPFDSGQRFDTRTGAHSMSNLKGNIKHGYSKTVTYLRWKSMISRCCNPKATNYPYYGARGITVWEPWRKSFETFLADIGECPDNTMTLERLDGELGYTPENCIWATKTAQNRNKPSHCVPLAYNGKTQILSDWAREIGMTPNALRQRIALGWSVERALTQTLKKRTVK